MKVIYNRDKNILLKQAAEKLGSFFEMYKDAPILFLVSSGSALEILDAVDTGSFGSHVTLSVLDERFSIEPSVNNFLRLKATNFYARALAKGVSFIETVPLVDETLESFAERFEKALRAWKEKNPGGKIIITQGVGMDGHTAGIAPQSKVGTVLTLQSENRPHFAFRWITGYNTGDTLTPPLRVTVTIPFLRNVVDHSIVYAVGQNKQKALFRVLSKEGTIEQIPARVIREMKDVYLFTNQKVLG